MRPVLPDDLARFAPRPASEVEWEDLLIRLEIVPRVVRHEMEGADPAEPGLVALLGEVVRREARVGAWLETLAAAAAGAGAPAAPREERESDAEWLSHRFASLRARTFVMVQRRGLEVWGWAGEVEPGRTATVHQLLSWLAEQDGRALFDLRRATRC
jgi:hypothetical protein